MSESSKQRVITRARRRALQAGRKLKYRMTTSSSTRRAKLVGPPERWETGRVFQFEFLTSQGLLPGHRLLDIGCGTLRGGIPLIEYLDAGHYAGIEARAKVLTEARKELAESGLEPKRPVLINAADPAQVQLASPVDFAWAFMVLIHMSDEIVDGYLALVSRELAGGGQFYANAKLGDHRSLTSAWQGFPVNSRPREFYEQMAASHGLIMEDVGTTGSLGHPVRASTIHGGDVSMMFRFTRAS